MQIKSQKPNSGFSLVELLLTLVLILCLAAASVFCYTAIHKQANLDEGVDRWASILLLARAEAATSGRKVRVQFVTPAPVDGEKSELKAIKVEWEPDYLKAPGVFRAFTNKAWSEDVVNELVAVEKVESLKTEESKTSSNSSSADPAITAPGGEAGTAIDFLEEFEILDMPAITFYPDGSSDSAQITVTSRNEEDTRRAEVTISGILGSVSTRMVSSSSSTLNEMPGALAEEDFEAVWDSSTPTSNPQPVRRSAGEFSAY